VEVTDRGKRSSLAFYNMAIITDVKCFIVQALCREWNNALCLILIKAYRGQLWKDKQNKNSEEKIGRKSDSINLLILKVKLFIAKSDKLLELVSLNVKN
jgi:hypothetical protein